MTVLNPPIAVQARADHAADDLRGAIAAGMAGVGGSMKPRQGVLAGWGTELAVSQRAAGANMSVDVAQGGAMLQAPTDGHGGWFLLNDAVLNLTIAAAHATLPRIDLVIARVADAQYHTGGDGAASVKVVTGTAAASPVAPTVPVADGAYIVLGQVAVAAAATSIVNANITLNTSTTVPRTVGLGGILPVINAAARTALVPYAGQQVLQLDTADLWTWTGTAWEGGWTPFTPSSVAVTFSSIIGEYRKTGRVVEVRYTGLFAGFSGPWSITLPFAALSAPTIAVGTASIQGANSAVGTVIIKSGANSSWMVWSQQNGGNVAQQWSNVFPFTPAVGDMFGCSFRYETV